MEHCGDYCTCLYKKLTIEKDAREFVWKASILYRAPHAAIKYDPTTDGYYEIHHIAALQRDKDPEDSMMMSYNINGKPIHFIGWEKICGVWMTVYQWCPRSIIDLSAEEQIIDWNLLLSSWLPNLRYSFSWVVLEVKSLDLQLYRV